jgi:hypothetical protein
VHCSSPPKKAAAIPNTLPSTDEYRDNVGSSEFYQCDPHDDGIPTNGRTQAHYMRQFVDRVHPMLTALLSREVLPHGTTCGRCSDSKIAIWRCRDCTASRFLCRGCMRNCHMDSPTHHIEVWTGEYFRRAEMWEAGQYILVRHHTNPDLCSTLQFQTNVLDGFQRQKDITEQQKLTAGIMHGGHSYRQNNQKSRETEMPSNDRVQDEGFDIDMDSGEGLPTNFDEHNEEEDFAQFVRRLDEMYKRTNEGVDNNEGNNDMTGEDQDYGVDETDELPPIPENYIPVTSEPPTKAAADTVSDIPTVETPQVDALNNPYVRVVHTNGIHHIGLVYCTCRGIETTHADLMAAGLVPTSFSRYKTMFTHSVLDDFRMSNLECKASAYQYFQKLRRQTSPMSPDSVPNLYHELRRMSRLWRWMKKLKWAGLAHRPDFTIDPKPGELANFCPACPQPGVNIPESWLDDTNRYVTTLSAHLFL